MEQRRLAAIMFSDIAGYSRMMGKSETLAIGLLKEHNKVIEAGVAEYGGTIIKRMGDGLLIEFPSAVTAVRCAQTIQKRFALYNKSVPEGKRIWVRIGIHLGDIVASGNDILGDGVNVASRIEPLAEPGGICISQDVFNQIQGKVEVNTVSIGPQEMKNIERNIEIYRVLVEATGLTPPRRPWKMPRWAGWAAAGVVAIAAVMGVIVARRKRPAPNPSVSPATLPASADPPKPPRRDVPDDAERREAEKRRLAERTLGFVRALAEENEAEAWTKAKEYYPPGRGERGAPEKHRGMFGLARGVIRLTQSTISDPRVESVAIDDDGRSARVFYSIQVERSGRPGKKRDSHDLKWIKIDDEWYVKTAEK